MSDTIEQLAALLAAHCSEMDTAHVGAVGFDGITFRFNPIGAVAIAQAAIQGDALADQERARAEKRWTVFTCFGKSDGPTLKAALHAHIDAIPDVLADHVERVQANHAVGLQLRERLLAIAPPTEPNEQG